MLQWTGGSRKKVSASRNSIQSKQKQYFEQRRRQQQTNGIENQSDYLNNNKFAQNSESKSLDILNFINLASIAQNKEYNHTNEDNIYSEREHKHHLPKLSTPLLRKFSSSEANNGYISKELDNDLPILSPAMAVKKIISGFSNKSNNSDCAVGTLSFHENFGDFSTQESVPTRNCNENMDHFEHLAVNKSNKSGCFQGTSSLHENFGSFGTEVVLNHNSKEKLENFEKLPPLNKSKAPDLKHSKQCDAQSGVSVFDLLFDEDLQRSSINKAAHESHVSFSIKGLGKVEAETPPQSPMPYQRIYPEPPARATRSNKSKVFQPVSFDAKFELDPIMRDINVHGDIRWSKNDINFEEYSDAQAYEEYLPFENSNLFKNLKNNFDSEPYGIYGDEYKYNTSWKGSCDKKINVNSPGEKYDKMWETNLFNSEGFFANSPNAKRFEVNTEGFYANSPMAKRFEVNSNGFYANSPKVNRFEANSEVFYANSPKDKRFEVNSEGFYAKSPKAKRIDVNSEGFYANSPKAKRFEFDSGFEEDNDFTSLRCGMNAKRKLDLNSAKSGPSCPSVAFDWERNSPKLKRKSEVSHVFSPPVWSFKEELNDLHDTMSLRSEESCASTKVKDVKNFSSHSQAPKGKDFNLDLNFEIPKFDDITSKIWEERQIPKVSRTKMQKTSFSKDDMFLDLTPSPEANLLNSLPDFKMYKNTNKPSKNDTFNLRPSKMYEHEEENSDIFNKLERVNSRENKSVMFNKVERENSRENKSVLFNKVERENSREKRETCVEKVGSDLKENCSEIQGLNCESDKISGMDENLENNEINEGALVVVPEPPLQIMIFDDNNDNNTQKTPIQSQDYDNTQKTPYQSQDYDNTQETPVQDDFNKTSPFLSQIGKSEEEKGRMYQIMLQSYALQRSL